ncbi:hypothetical protein EDD21DRAFT_316625, partial [Dissophora ornata]
MYFVHAKGERRDCLCLLLSHARGKIGHQDMRAANIDGLQVVHNTFKRTALALQLLGDDNEWRRCLQEAATLQMARSLRHLFAVIL